MNTLTRSIAEVCAEYRFQEKWLLAPSRRAAYQWIENVARGGQPALNLRAATLRGLVLHLAGPEMARRGLSLLSGRAAELLVDRLWNRDVRPGGEYLARMEPEAEFCRVLYFALRDLRLAGLEPDDLDPATFEDERKGREIVRLMQTWEAALEQEGRLDYAGALRLARRALADPGLPPGMRVLLPEFDEDEYSALEHEFIDALPADALLSLARDEPGRAREPATDLSLLAWLPEPGAAPDPPGDGSVEYFQAVGCANEVRHALRRCLAEGRPLDHVELLHTDPDTYVPLVYEACCEMWGGDGTDLPGALPVTFAEGLPVRYSRPGRALAAWLEWWQNDCPQSVLVRMLQENLLTPPAGAEEEFDPRELADALRPVPIGGGRDRYEPGLRKKLQSLRQRAQVQLGTDEEGEPVPDEEERHTMERAARRARGMAALADMVEDLLRVTPRPGDDPAQVLTCTLSFLADHVRSAGRLDEFASKALVREAGGLRDLLPGDAEVSLDVVRWLRDLPRTVRVLGQGARPGCLHVANVDRGGHSGRPVTVLIGMDDGRFPGGGTQDPVLLDGERRSISDRLPRRSRRRETRVRRLARTLAGLRGRLLVGCSCRDVHEDREIYPGSAMLAAYRLTSSHREADPAELLEALGPAASFAPEGPDGCLGEAEWWLWRLCTADAVREPMEAALCRYEHLRRGRRAEQARISPEFTPFDGRVPTAGRDHDPTAPDGPTVSASALETLGRCPLQFFFGRVLGVKPPDELEMDPDRWLDYAQRGTLLHRTFHDFMVELVQAGSLPPDFERDLPRLLEVLDGGVQYWRSQVPPPNESVFRRELADLRASCRYFLAGEEQFCRRSTPRYLEAGIGVRPSNPPTEMDRPGPMPFELPGGDRVLTRARLDRVDQRPDGNWTVWDYKTGSATPYRKLEGRPFNGGRRVQHVLYLHTAEQALRRVHPEASVVSFGYFLPGPTGRGERVELTREQLTAGPGLVEHLARMIAAGAFLPTDNHRSTCDFCDFKGICGDVEALTRAAKEKLNNEDIEALQHFREARNCD